MVVLRGHYGFWPQLKVAWFGILRLLSANQTTQVGYDYRVTIYTLVTTKRHLRHNKRHTVLGLINTFALFSVEQNGYFHPLVTLCLKDIIPKQKRTAFWNGNAP